ncbi:MAG: chemotaxis protein CheW [Motiliproteus sp.]
MNKNNNKESSLESLPLPSTETLADFADIRHGFEIAGHRFLVPEGIYSELTSRTEICAIPDTPSFFLGFINHRGETLPVFSLERLLLKDSETMGRWILLIDKGTRTIGILLNSYPRTLNDLKAKNNIAAEGERIEPDKAINDEVFELFSGATFMYHSETWREFDHRRFCEYGKRNFINPKRAES